MEMRPPDDAPAWKQTGYRVIFEADTPNGRLFDVLLLIAIGLSVLVVMLESVRDISHSFGPALRAAEWFFTVTFLLEYLVRLAVVRRPLTYALSWMGLIDLLAVLPALAALLLAGRQYLVVIRTVRLLRVFRIFKLGRFIGEGEFILTALKAARFKISVFLTAVLTMVIIAGTLLYVAEEGRNGFTSIPKSVYWAIVTVTTVGYGDISPHTVMGQMLASMLMIMGYAVIAVPTGIVSAQMMHPPPRYKLAVCLACRAPEHHPSATFCWRCGGGI